MPRQYITILKKKAQNGSIINVCISRSLDGHAGSQWLFSHWYLPDGNVAGPPSGPLTMTANGPVVKNSQVRLRRSTCSIWRIRPGSLP